MVPIVMCTYLHLFAVRDNRGANRCSTLWGAPISTCLTPAQVFIAAQQKASAGLSAHASTQQDHVHPKIVDKRPENAKFAAHAPAAHKGKYF